MNQEGTRHSTSALLRYPVQAKFDLNMAIKKLVHLRQHDYRQHNIEVILDLDAELPEATVDCQQIESVLLVLLFRSRQAIIDTKSHGTIAVRTGLRGERIQFSITDNGRVFFTPQESINLMTCAEIVQDEAGELYAWRQRDPAVTTIMMDLPV